MITARGNFLRRWASAARARVAICGVNLSRNKSSCCLGVMSRNLKTAPLNAFYLIIRKRLNSRACLEGVHHAALLKIDNRHGSVSMVGHQSRLPIRTESEPHGIFADLQ